MPIHPDGSSESGNVFSDENGNGSFIKAMVAFFIFVAVIVAIVSLSYSKSKSNKGNNKQSKASSKNNTVDHTK